jgi:hypothetical protein
MTTADTVRRLLSDAAGEALCDSCLAFACSVSLTEMQRATEELLSTVGFARSDRCASCRRTVPAINYTAKCAHCSRGIKPGDDALEIGGDLFHAACFRILVSDDTIRTSRNLTKESRRLIEDSRRQMRARRRPPDTSASSG